MEILVRETSFSLFLFHNPPNPPYLSTNASNIIMNTKFAAVFGIVMSVFFIISGILIPIHPPLTKLFQGKPFPDWAPFIVGFILVIYGLFRLSRAYALYKRS